MTVTNTNAIEMFLHCAKCMPDKPDHVPPSFWAKLAVGFTTPGLQVWCERCNVNVCHIDFEGQRHPANTTRKTDN